VNDTLTRDCNGRGFDSRQVHHFPMKYILIALLLLGCVEQPKDLSVHDDIIEQDLYNKQCELNILRELFVAQQHNDEDSFTFFVSEYIRVPRLKLTPEQKKHPRFKKRISDEIIKSGAFMHVRFNYIP